MQLTIIVYNIYIYIARWAYGSKGKLHYSRVAEKGAVFAIRMIAGFTLSLVPEDS